MPHTSEEIAAQAAAAVAAGAQSVHVHVFDDDRRQTLACRAGRTVLLMAGRYALLALLAYAMIARLRLHPIGLLAGASSVVAAATFEAVRQLTKKS